MRASSMGARHRLNRSAYDGRRPNHHRGRPFPGRLPKGPVATAGPLASHLDLLPRRWRAAVRDRLPLPVLSRCGRYRTHPRHRRRALRALPRRRADRPRQRARHTGRLVLRDIRPHAGARTTHPGRPGLDPRRASAVRPVPCPLRLPVGSGRRSPPAVEHRRRGVGGLSAYEFPRLRLLQPASLPPMVDEEHHGRTVRLVAAFPAGDPQAIAVDLAQSSEAEQARWAALLERGEAVVVPPHTRRRVLIDLVTYLCAYPTLEVSGGAGGEVRVGWTESLCHTPDLWCKRKGDRNAIDGKNFAGVGDTFLPDGGPHRHFDTLWWQAGRYVELLISTRDEPLTVERSTLRETRYPLELESRFAASDSRLARTLPNLVRGMQMCSHETYIDCPYYEQLMYAGDTRLEALTTYIMTRDSRLPRKALDLFDRSRLASGLTQSRYPSNVLQIIAPFA